MKARPLHFVWMLDCSGSMVGENIQALNTAIAEGVPLMRSVADANPHAEVLIRVVTFADRAEWHLAEPTPISEFRWKKVRAVEQGSTYMGAALSLVADAFDIPPMPRRGLPPVLVLVSDGVPADNFEEGLAKLLATPWGSKAIRVAIAIGRDADYDLLHAFMGGLPDRLPLQANSTDDIAEMVRWSSTVVVKQASRPKVNDWTSRDPLSKPPAPKDLVVWDDVPGP